MATNIIITNIIPDLLLLLAGGMEKLTEFIRILAQRKWIWDFVDNWELEKLIGLLEFVDFTGKSLKL